MPLNIHHTMTLAAALLVSIAARSPASQITHFHVRSSPDSSEVVIETTAPLEFKSDRLTKPDRIFFDFFDAQPSAEYRNSGVHPIHDALIKQFRIGATSGGSTRVVFDMVGWASYSFTRLKEPDRLVIEFRPSRAASAMIPRENARAEVAGTPRAEVAPSTASLPATLAPPPATPLIALYSPGTSVQSLTRALGLGIQRIVIDAGHGGQDYGAVSRNGLREKDVTLDIALRLAELLRNRTNSTVFLTRSDDTFVSLRDRTQFANLKNGDIFLSVHANSSPSTAGSGTETYYLSFTNSGPALAIAGRENSDSGRTVAELKDTIESIARSEKITESRALALVVGNSLFAGAAKTNSGVQNHGVKQAPFVVLIGAAMPAALAEVGFLNNPRDEASLRTAEYREKIAEALYDGLSQYSRALGRLEFSTRADAPTVPAVRDVSPITDQVFESQGVQWRIPAADCIAHDVAVKKIPAGFELPGEEELSELSRNLRLPASKALRAALPYLMRKDSTVWTSHLQTISDRWYVVRLADGEILSQVPDSCAYVVARQSAMPK